MKTTTDNFYPRTGEDLKAHSLGSRLIFSESHLNLSLSGKNDPNSFAEFLHLRLRRFFSSDPRKSLVLFRSLFCDTVDE